MIGTRAHGRSRVYRYYTCFTRARYDAARRHPNPGWLADCPEIMIHAVRERHG